ncbi:major royal jelly protein 1 [Neodiprion pinetum]|uniref:major royal jelly protein 1 n=1 Tax=Neodiprion pinetum TaxID=441929 RepID=UPI001EDE5508|nr:major royal jelly protein 1-like [Neodiprion pinetum]
MDISIWFVSAVVLLTSVAGNAGATGLEIVYQWKYLDWVPPSVQLVGNNFTLGNAFTQDVDIDRKGRVFVTSPKWPEGVPIVLSTITDVNGPGGPLLEPYPDWTWHRFTDCNSIVTAYRIAIDEYNRLWVTDIGRIGAERVCPTKILVFDLFTDQLIHKYVIPDEHTLNGAAALVTPIVDIGDSPIDTFLYMADVDANGIVVYDFKSDYSWRINNTQNNAFGPDDEAMEITIVDDTFNLTDGTLGMSLSPKGFWSTRYLYFNSLASYYQKFTDTDSLKRAQYEEPIIFQSKKRRQSQAGPQATSRRGILFFQLVQHTALACWNIEKPFKPENVVVLAQDEVALQYISGIKVIVNHIGEEEVWFNTNRLQKTINNNRNPAETNYRIIKGKVDDLVRGTNCESSGPHTNYLDISSWRRI